MKIFKKILFWTPVVLVGIMLFINALSLLYPVIWGLNASFKDTYDYVLFPNSLPNPFRFENYQNILSNLKVEVLTEKGIVRVGLGIMIQNTLLWSVFSPLPGSIVVVLMAYVIALYRNRFTKFIYDLGIVLMCLVVVGTFPAQFALYKQLNIYDNMFMVILTGFQGGFSGFNFLLYYGIFRGIPKDYGDAARIDGAGHYSVMFHIYIPEVLTTWFVFYVMSFLGAWNDYNTFLIYLPSYPSLSYGMYLYQYNAVANHASYPEILAGFFMVAIPTAIMYFLVDKKLVESLKVSGLKG